MRPTHASIGHRLKLDPKVTADQRGHGVGVAIEENTKTSVKDRAAAAKKLEQKVLGTRTGGARKRGSAREFEKPPIGGDLSVLSFLGLVALGFRPYTPT